MRDLQPLPRTEGIGAYSSLIAFIFVLAGIVYFIISRTYEPPQHTRLNNTVIKTTAENSLGKQALKAGQSATSSNELIASEEGSNKADARGEEKIAELSEEKISTTQNAGLVVTSTYLSHNGDTLKKIAIRLYGNSNNAAALARKNPTIKLKQILPAGVSILLPSELKKLPQK